jgi:hypothetical protein
LGEPPTLVSPSASTGFVTPQRQRGTAVDLIQAMQAATEDPPASAIDIDELITRERRRSRNMPPCHVPTHPGGSGSPKAASLPPKTRRAAPCEGWFHS